MSLQYAIEKGFTAAIDINREGEYRCTLVRGLCIMVRTSEDSTDEAVSRAVEALLLVGWL